MTDKRARVPGPDHSITIERNPARIVVSVAGRVIADTREALTLSEEVLVEHWDVVEDEASRADSKSGRPMFGDRFPA
jgi:uncharacterized protein (DUF427 family)